jgi:hypothetical protein
MISMGKGGRMRRAGMEAIGETTMTACRYDFVAARAG